MGNFRIKDFRKAKGLLQSEMAQVIGLTQSNFSRYENNNIDLTDCMLDKLREKYGEEEVNTYLTSGMPDVEPREGHIEDMRVSDLVDIVKTQNETIRHQLDVQNEFSQRLANMASRLLDLLEKIKFE